MELRDLARVVQQQAARQDGINRTTVTRLDEHGQRLDGHDAHFEDLREIIEGQTQINTQTNGRLTALEDTVFSSIGRDIVLFIVGFFLTVLLLNWVVKPAEQGVIMTHGFGWVLIVAGLFGGYAATGFGGGIRRRPRQQQNQPAQTTAAAPGTPAPTPAPTAATTPSPDPVPPPRRSIRDRVGVGRP